MVLVFGELVWEAEGGQALFHFSKHLQLLVEHPLLSLELEVHVSAPALQLPSGFGSPPSSRMLCGNGLLGSLVPAPCGSGNCIT